MGDENPIRTLRDYSKPSNEGYMNTIEFPIRNNVIRLRSDTIRLVQNGCSFHGLRFEDPNQHLKDFLKLVGSPDLDGSITTWEDITTRLLAQFFLPERTVKLRNDIMIFQQHHGESLSEAWTRMQANEAEKKNEAGKEEMIKVPSSQPVEYYLKHSINKKLIEGLSDNRRFNDSLTVARFRKIKGKTYNLTPMEPVYEAILRKKITRKEDIGGNFEIPCNIGGLKYMNALVDQDPILSLPSHSYIYPLGKAEEILVEVAEHVYPVDFVILDIMEDEKRPFILGTPFLTTAKAVIKFDKGTITLRFRKSKISFHRIPESLLEDEMRDEEEIRLYLMRRILEILRKFHWMILKGRSNQLSHVSSPLLSKPEEY
uniref:Retrotransposon gag domain-containing protein n=1 Tax=Tanacetum cinerariifolium TaxID=118510 RepID=A0A6L2K246_TANCI|nr:hypothetical protein [Tanacetum cinerariifolium]